MASIFWDFEGLMLVGYPQIAKPITRESYADYLKRLRDDIKQMRPEMLTKGILFHQVKAAAHNLMVAIKKYVTVGTSSFKTRLTRRDWPPPTSTSSYTCKGHDWKTLCDG